MQKLFFSPFSVVQNERQIYYSIARVEIKGMISGALFYVNFFKRI